LRVRSGVSVSSARAAFVIWRRNAGCPSTTQDPARYEQLRRVGQASAGLPGFAIYLICTCSIASSIVVWDCAMPHVNNQLDERCLKDRPMIGLTSRPCKCQEHIWKNTRRLAVVCALFEHEYILCWLQGFCYYFQLSLRCKRRLHFIVMVIPRSELRICVFCLEHISLMHLRAPTVCLGPRSSGLAGTGVAVHQQL
jgi:hypothetical protein